MTTLSCHRCGTSLAALSLPLQRLDLCPNCNAYLYACKMCLNFAPARPSACNEEDAIEVSDKTSANFCDYFKPNPDAFDRGASSIEQDARTKLESLFATDGGATANNAPETTVSPNEDADALFRS